MYARISPQPGSTWGHRQASWTQHFSCSPNYTPGLSPAFGPQGIRGSTTPHRPSRPQPHLQRAATPAFGSSISAVQPEAQPVVDEAQQRRDRATARMMDDLMQVATRSGVSSEELHCQLEVFSALLPGVTPNLHVMRASDWLTILKDSTGLASKIIVMKQLYPKLNLAFIMDQYPRVFLCTEETLKLNNQQIQCVLSSFASGAEADVADQLFNDLPELMEPRNLASVLFTVRKWFPKKHPITVVLNDPDLIKRAQRNDAPLEPVFFDGVSWTAATYSRDKQTDWQKYIETTVYKRRPNSEKAGITAGY